MVKKAKLPVDERQAQQNTSSTSDKLESYGHARIRPGAQIQIPLRSAVAGVSPCAGILSDQAAPSGPRCAGQPNDDVGGGPVKQCVNIEKQRGTTHISGMVAGNNACQVFCMDSEASWVISNLEAGDNSTQLIYVSDKAGKKDSFEAFLEIALAPRRSIRGDPKHLQPAEITRCLPDMLHISNFRGSGPVFGGLNYQEDHWECFRFDQYPGAKWSTENNQCKKLLDEARVDLETWICLVVFVSLLAHCAEYEGQTMLCPNWLWAKQRVIFGSKPGQPQATLHNLWSLIEKAPARPVRVGSWAKSCIFEMWHAARRERCQRGLEQDIRTIRAVKACFLDEGSEMYN